MFFFNLRRTLNSHNMRPIDDELNMPGHHTLQVHKQIKYPHSDHTGHIQARICRPRPISGGSAQRETAHVQTKAGKKHYTIQVL